MEKEAKQFQKKYYNISCHSDKYIGTLWRKCQEIEREISNTRSKGKQISLRLRKAKYLSQIRNNKKIIKRASDDILKLLNISFNEALKNKSQDSVYLKNLRMAYSKMNFIGMNTPFHLDHLPLGFRVLAGYFQLISISKYNLSNEYYNMCINYFDEVGTNDDEFVEILHWIRSYIMNSKAYKESNDEWH